jgi:hypothetical protein
MFSLRLNFNENKNEEEEEAVLSSQRSNPIC